MTRVLAWMVLSILSFASMAVAAREMSHNLSVFQMLALRSGVGLIVMSAVMLVLRARFRTARPGLHLSRNLAHFAGIYCWTLGVIHLPLSEVVALEFTVPLWVTLLAAFVLRESLTRARLLAVMGGFAGVLVIVRPGVALLDPYITVMLISSLCIAGSVLMVKTLTRTDDAAQVLFYQTLIQLPLGVVLAAPDWVTPSLTDVPWITVYAIGGLTAHLGLTRALMLADAVVVMPIDYLRLPVLTVLGVGLYAESLQAWVILGAAIIMLSTWLGARAERRRPIAHEEKS